MLRLVGYRLATVIPLVLLVALIVFFLESLVPGNAAQTILGAHATPAQVASLTRQLDLNHPWYVQYGSWVSELVQGHLGTSVFTGETVTSMLDGGLGVTLSIVLASIVVSAIVGTVLGAVSAVRGGILGRLIDVVSLLGLALPSFWIAIALVAIFAVKLRLLPATGFVPLTHSPLQWLRSLVLPVVALSLIGVASIAKQARDATKEVLEADFIRVLRASGVSEARVIWRHVVRNAAIPVLTVTGLVATALLGGTVFIEQVFVMNGLGSIATTATQQHDLPVILGVSVYFTLFVVAVNLLIDIAYGLLNPKVRVA